MSDLLLSNEVTDTMVYKHIKYFMLLKSRFLKIAFDSIWITGPVKATQYLIWLSWKYLEPSYFF